MQSHGDAVRVLYGAWGPDGDICLDPEHTVLTVVPGWNDLGAGSSMVPGPNGFSTITIPGKPVSPAPSASWDSNDFSLMLLFPEGSNVDVTNGTITYPAGKGFQLLDSKQVEYHTMMLSAGQP